MAQTSGAIIIFVTCPTRAVGMRIARALVTQRLAACVNLLPGITSIYTWKRRVETAREVLLLIKTTPARWPALRRAVRSLHPYDVPEIIATPLVAAHAPYVAWVRQSVRPTGKLGPAP